MSATTFFYQECPVCGRSLRVPVKYFGREMSCSHCAGEFIAGKEKKPADSCHQAAEADLAGSMNELLRPAAFSHTQLGEV